MRKDGLRGLDDVHVHDGGQGGLGGATATAAIGRAASEKNPAARWGSWPGSSGRGAPILVRERNDDAAGDAAARRCEASKNASVAAGVGGCRESENASLRSEISSARRSTTQEKQSQKPYRPPQVTWRSVAPKQQRPQQRRHQGDHAWTSVLQLTNRAEPLCPNRRSVRPSLLVFAAAMAIVDKKAARATAQSGAADREAQRHQGPKLLLQPCCLGRVAARRPAVT